DASAKSMRRLQSSNGNCDSNRAERSATARARDTLRKLFHFERSSTPDKEAGSCATCAPMGRPPHERIRNQKEKSGEKCCGSEQRLVSLSAKALRAPACFLPIESRLLGGEDALAQLERRFHHCSPSSEPLCGRCAPALRPPPRQQRPLRRVVDKR